MTGYPEENPEVFDVVVIGGGLAGTIAAIAAARLGSKTALIQDRPVLGGNSSNEVRVSVSGASAHGNNRNARETGIIEELYQEMVFRDEWPEGNGSPRPLWDWLLWEWVNRERKLSLFLNTRAQKAIMASTSRIQAVLAFQSSTERYLTFEAEYFIDCSGDGQIAADAGAEFRMGRESRHEFNEYRAPENADSNVLCPSLLFSAKDKGRTIPFQPPPWAHRFLTEESLGMRHHPQVDYGYAWIELGGEQDMVHDTDVVRDELLSYLYGVWDHIKNGGEHGAQNWALDWIQFLPGKRESRRLISDYILTQNDIESGGQFPDVVAYGGWPMDAHAVEGIRFQGPHTQFYYTPSPYGIPYRCLYSRNIENLMFAGRNISASHMALTSTRVIATCAILGQAVGTAAVLAITQNCTPRDVGQKHISTLQQ